MIGNRANHIQHLANLVDLAGQLFNLFRGDRHIAGQQADRLQRLFDLIAPLQGGLIGRLRSIGGARRVARHLFNGGSHLVHRRRRLIDLGALLVQAAAGVFSHCVQFFRRRGQLVRRAGYLPDRVAQAVLHRAQRTQEHGRFVVAGNMDFLGQLPRCYALGHLNRLSHGGDDATGQQDGNDRHQQQNDHQHGQHYRHCLGERFATVLRGGIGTFRVEVDQRRQRVQHRIGMFG
ncbi:hypothetical protein D3C79_799360 [compost metagenome]